MARIKMYATGWCPYCIRAEQLLRAKGVAEIEKLRVDLDPPLKDEMIAKTGRRTVPQIYIGDTHVGGFDDMAELDRRGELDSLLASA
ncbi:MAG: glutaredoxin 3 [Burkholderiales bacterium]